MDVGEVYDIFFVYNERINFGTKKKRCFIAPLLVVCFSRVRRNGYFQSSKQRQATHRQRRKIMSAPRPTTDRSNTLDDKFVSVDDIPSFFPFSNKSTSCKISAYERARLLGTRAINLHHGMPPLVKLQHNDDPLSIARREITEKVLPVVIRRHFPSGAHEDWKLAELQNVT